MDQRTAALALRWYLENGVDEVLDHVCRDYTQDNMPSLPAGVSLASSQNFDLQKESKPHSNIVSSNTDDNRSRAAGTLQPDQVNSSDQSSDVMFLGANDALQEAINIASQATNLQELQESIAEFNGISLKKTATNMVFSDGCPEASIMVVGEAPGADEDRLGKPFVGLSGQLLDKIFGSIGLSRSGKDPHNSIYISNILNWRPPGNRTPSPEEILVSLPFIERHIQLINPKVLVLAGGVSAKALLGKEQSISRLRKVWHEYQPSYLNENNKNNNQENEKKEDQNSIITLATYHPAYLLRTPTQKRALWADMIMLQKKRIELGLLP